MNKLFVNQSITFVIFVENNWYHHNFPLFHNRYFHVIVNVSYGHVIEISPMIQLLIVMLMLRQHVMLIGQAVLMLKMHVVYVPVNRVHLNFRPIDIFDNGKYIVRLKIYKIKYRQCRCVLILKIFFFKFNVTYPTRH